MNNNGFVSSLKTTIVLNIVRLRDALNAGPGNTSGEPMSVAGHLVFASAPSHAAQNQGV